jgi:hypothetical protein
MIAPENGIDMASTIWVMNMIVATCAADINATSVKNIA